MYVLILASLFGADFSSWTALENRVSQNEAAIVALRNDVEALKKMCDKCDVASKAPDPKPVAKCPDGVCADCKCKLGDECGCLKLQQLPELTPATAEPTPVTTYREVRTCRGGVCTVQMVAVDATDETPQVMLRQRSGYSSPCASGNCGVSRTRRGLFGRRR